MHRLSIALCLFTGVAEAQNLVPNGDFESYTQCPDYVSQIDRAEGWSRPTEGTSDYFNACLGVPFSESVPDNEFGYEPAHSGNGYAGFYSFFANSLDQVPGSDYREYVTHALSAPLVPGESYTVEFYVSLSDVSKYAVNDIGALLSVQPPTRNDDLTITATPQVMNTSLAMLSNKNGWTRISGCIVADSAFAYVTVGNFHVGTATVYEEVSTSYPLIFYSYYYVDDVSVRHLSAPDLGPDLTTCESVVIAVQEPEPDATYTWSTGEMGYSIVADTAGIYTVMRETDGCLLSDTIVVTIAEPFVLSMPSDTAVNFCETTHVNIGPTNLPADANVIWNTGETTPEITISAIGLYTVTASGPTTCGTSATVHVRDLCSSPVFAPNAFSPNGDGINDHWRPVWIANENVELELTIFDRWGRALFAGVDDDVTWDGTADGEPVPVGVYTWRGRARDPATDKDVLLHGRIDLLR